MTAALNRACIYALMTLYITVTIVGAALFTAWSLVSLPFMWLAGIAWHRPGTLLFLTAAGLVAWVLVGV